MNLSAAIAEQRIQQAIDEGALDELPGAGEPLALDGDDPFMPTEVRMAYKVMKNAGYLPPEVKTRKQIAGMATLMQAATSDDERSAASRRLHYLMLQLQCGRRYTPAIDAAYFDQK